MVITVGQVGELLEMLDLLDALMPAKFAVEDRKGSRYFKAQVIDLHLILQTSDNHMLQADQGITPLDTRAYLMTVLPHALAKAFPAFVTLNHGCYSAKYYPDNPLDWIAEGVEKACDAREATKGSSDAILLITDDMQTD